MQKVLGFGGFFFRAKDPVALAEWYETHLGIDPVPTDAETPPWMPTGGATVFAPFARDTDYFPARSSFMLNFRVSNLDAMVAQLAKADIPVRLTEEVAEIGRFAHLSDPEGNPIELWEPEAS
jgi:predicted enzyme related to lactoylglutathione lyase